MAALKRAGFGTLRLPESLGGPGITVPQLFSTIIDLAAADPIVAHIFRTHFWFVEERLRTADDASSRRWLDKVVDGRSSVTLPDGHGGYRLTGEKYDSTGTLLSDYLTATATTDHDSVATVVALSVARMTPTPAQPGGVQVPANAYF